MPQKKAVIAQPRKPAGVDPLNVNARLYAQIARLLDDLEDADAREEMTFPQRVSALIAVGRIQIMFNTLRKGFDNGTAGSAVRKYAGIFSPSDAASRRASNARSAESGELDSFGDDSGDSD